MSLKVLLVVDYGSKGSIGPRFEKAFREAGCKIEIFDDAHLDREGPFSRSRTLRKLVRPIVTVGTNRSLLAAAVRYSPDLIIIFKGTLIRPGTVLELRRRTQAILMNWNGDHPLSSNPGRSNAFIRRSIPHYDVYLTWTGALLPVLRSLGARRVERLHCACDPTLHFPEDVSTQDHSTYGSDAAFIGTWEQDRVDRFEILRGLNLKVWGDDWMRAHPSAFARAVWQGRAAMEADFRKVCSASKIVLNLFRQGVADTHNMKTFEIPACGGFVLSERSREVAEFFDEGKEIACFSTPEEMRQKTEYYLRHMEERVAMTEAARSRTQSHTYLERAKRILSLFESVNGSAV